VQPNSKVYRPPTRFRLDLTRRREAGEEREANANRNTCHKNKKSGDINEERKEHE
jgi:hypothetical protein